MHVWLVNPFDPLPGSEEQPGRYLDLARSLVARGHRVTWWSCDFSHRFKRTIDLRATENAAREMGIDVRLVPVPPYRRNVSLRRMWSHDRFARKLLVAARPTSRPDIILASSPPLESAAAMVRLAGEWKVPSIVDIQDQWPDNFARVMPAWVRPVGALALARYYAIERAAYSGATAITGVARGYVERGRFVGGEKMFEGVFPLGVDLNRLASAATRGSSTPAKPPGERWVMYSGSLSHNYDVLTLIHAAARSRAEGLSSFRLFISGAGELAGDAQRIVTEKSLDNVTLAGFMPFADWAALLLQCDVGVNASFPDALIYLPNKIFYYLGAGLAVLNTIPGECAEVIAESGCGLTYTAGDVPGCANALRDILADAEELERMKSAARQLASSRFDRPRIATDFAAFIETVLGETAGTATR